MLHTLDAPRPTETSHLLFDFDGTLVDSAPGILDSMRGTFARTGLKPALPLTELILGLPLRPALVKTLGTDDATQIERLETSFREHYDEQGYRGTRPYPGMPEALGALRAAGHRLHIVTNKRMVPTQLILAELEWDALFDSVHTLDTSPGLTRKAEVVAGLLPVLMTPGASVAMIGDTDEDAAAAYHNGLPFTWVRWGYGREVEAAMQGRSVHSVTEMLEHLLNRRT